MSGSRLLFLDEPFEGVAPSLVQRLVRAVRELVEAERGVSALLCESEFKWPRLLASHIYLIERGETVDKSAELGATPPMAQSQGSRAAGTSIDGAGGPAG